jgi:DNA-binding NarL/FixJ family response regulator
VTPTDQPTPAELKALRAYWQAGSINGAAKLLKLSPDTIRGQLRSIRSKVGAHSTARAIWLLRDKLAA